MGIVTELPSPASGQSSLSYNTYENKTPAVQEISFQPADLAEPENTTDQKGFWSSIFSRKSPRDLDAIATTRSVFDDPTLAQYNQPHPEYENLHRFDPSERWSYREEQAVRRKTDLRIFSWILVMFFALNIDRGNLGNAVADNLLKDLHITTNDYNNAQNIYRVGFLIAEIPSQMIGKRLGPDRWSKF
jgi:hypothetical protein